MIAVNPTSCATRKPARRRRLALLGAGVACVFVLMQALPGPDRENPPQGRTLAQSVPVPREVSHVLDRACANCHSNRTAWPWYSRVAPLSWMIGSHVERGRQAMNFSDWQQQGIDVRITTVTRMSAACAAIDGGLMPPSSYQLLHPEARLSPADKAAVCGWAKAETRALEASRAATSDNP